MKFGSDDTLSDWRIQDVPTNVEEMIKELVARIEKDEHEVLESEIEAVANFALEAIGGETYVDTYTIVAAEVSDKILVVLFKFHNSGRVFYGVGAFGYDDTDWNFYQAYLQGCMFGMLNSSIVHVKH